MPSSPLGMTAARLGIVAGAGDLPRAIVRACQRSGRPFFLVALDGFAEPALTEGVAHAWYRLGKAGAIVDRLHAEGVRELVFVGAVTRPRLAQWMPDARTLRFLVTRRAWRLGDGGLLNAMIATLENDGFRVVGPETIDPELLARLGPVGRLRPEADDERAIAFGLREALILGAADRGQGVVVQDGKVLDREDRAGTDALLARCRTRGGRRGDRPGGVLVKVTKPMQDRRVDLPAIGLRTVAGAQAAGLAGIAVEAAGALVVDRAAVAEAADRAGLFVAGVPREAEP